MVRSNRMRSVLAAAVVLVLAIDAFQPTTRQTRRTQHQHPQPHRFGVLSRRVPRVVLSLSDNSDNSDEASRMSRQAAELREQIRQMEAQLEAKGPRRREAPPPVTAAASQQPTGPTLVNKRVLVAGANGRLGSMVCRYLLRQHPKTEVVAAVHTISEDSVTSRGYGRVSYEVGAEDGVGNIGAAWSGEDRTATFEYDPETMSGHNLQNLRLVECELLDPVQCQSVVEGCDAVIWCASDFNGNTPRAVSGLNVAFLFRAVTRPDKGRVEVEGLQNMLGALKLAKQEQQQGSKATDDPTTDFVLVSMAPEAYGDFETPFGSFLDIKRQGEQMALGDFPSLSTTVLQLARYDDNFIEEGLDLVVRQQQKEGETAPTNTTELEKVAGRCINRRDAAKAAVDALVDESIVGKMVSVWTATR